MKIEIIELLSVETLLHNHKAISTARTGRKKKFLYIAYSAQLPSYKRKFFTASEEMPQLLTTHKEKY